MTISVVTAASHEADQYELLQKLQVFRLQGHDKRGHKILTILAKHFPGKTSVDVVKKYLNEEIYPKLEKEGNFSVLYIHTGVQHRVNFPGISALRCLYDSIPTTIKDNLCSVYFLHPDFQSRLFLATFGRLFFPAGLYGKVKYASRVELLREHIRRKEIELPGYVYDHDKALERRPLMDYGIESDHPRVSCGPSVDSPVASYSMRCIS